MMVYELGKDCYLFHSLVGHYPKEFLTLMREKYARDPDHEKFLAFYMGGDSVEEIEKSLGLDVREIICCASKRDPAAIYHKPYGLILSGEIKVMFDGDSGTGMSPEGIYPSKPYYKDAHKTDLNTLMTLWYEKFLGSKSQVYNEVVLKKGSRIIGAFYDPSVKARRGISTQEGTFKEQEYPKFLRKIKRLGLDLVEINARFK